MTWGSSPLARGTPACGVAGSGHFGVIPARAGNTTTRRIYRASTGGHPRSRGEHLTHGVIPWYRPGSSPLARGTPGPLNLLRQLRRVIPARAGNTVPPQSWTYAQRGHPRSRGEHGVAIIGPDVPPGSSPLARGTRTHTHIRPPLVWVIPARAGNTSAGVQRQEGHRGHPRSRGEHIICTRLFRASSGSSPLARGTRIDASAFTARLRVIPARAGNTLPARLPGCMSRGHPRSRGEHEAGFCFAFSAAGSSPLARGTHRLRAGGGA